MVTDSLKAVEQRMTGSIDILKKELAAIRTGRATPALVEHIKVEYGGTTLPLNQMAATSAPEARLLVIRPWDATSIRAIEKAILASDLGLNPASDGSIIRLAIPALTEERRGDLQKLVHRRVEERRVAIRNLRREAMETFKAMEKNKELSQDEHKRALDQLQRLTDRFISVAEALGRDKEAELAEV
jgi:ribosome recycling factor